MSRRQHWAAEFEFGHLWQWLLIASCLLFAGVSTASIQTSPDIITAGYGPISEHLQSQRPRRPDASQEQSVLSVKDNGLPVLQENGKHLPVSLESFSALLDALDVMQSHFFVVWQGSWPTAIEWTSAMIGTHISATLNVITRSNNYEHILPTETERASSAQNNTVQENLINRFFTHLTTFHFCENVFGLRGQAYDDMLWVVLSWLESIKLANLHSDIHYCSPADCRRRSGWYGKQFIPAFAHRARVFYELASKGWDTSLCGGGMIWNPRLAPYKNAVTNQLYITASVSMYLYFPGDENGSPFLAGGGTGNDEPLSWVNPHNRQHLEAAITGYDWLVSSNMTNSKGLYIDGFHIRGWRGGRDGSRGSEKCDLREEMVYTYNQGILLSGLRGLWEATGIQKYLEDGHRLIGNVISATAWHVKDIDERRRWAGLGRNGVLEDYCDARGSCNQDGQSFKGIFFHHLTTFCTPLPIGARHGVFFRADKGLASLHRQSCREYGPWIRHNAEAAYRTRDRKGEFGQWWNYQLQHPGSRAPGEAGDHCAVPFKGTDYRNGDVPNDRIWRAELDGFPSVDSGGEDESIVDGVPDQWDPNTRGRGRTAETQSGGLAVLRALYALVDMDIDGDWDGNVYDV